MTSASRALVVTPVLRGSSSSHKRSPEARLAEAVSLAQAIHLDIVSSQIISLSSILPSSYFGKGKQEELQALIAAEEIGLTIVDTQLSPVQQRNLEKSLQCKVIDRTALILEIFGERAQTSEGKLQVELAAFEYQKSRLVRSWTHLERQRGGGGFMGGPGERQIESDRRQLQERITALKGKLEKVKKTRELHRKQRRSIPYPIVALVGYTNAGKSTLFNYMTKAHVLAEDKLFATLDPTMRAITLPSGQKVLLSDTVGFVSDLPTHLVAAFRATLEEVLEADVLLHVRDISHEETEFQKQDVLAVLHDLGITRETDWIEVYNKIDLLGDEARLTIENEISRSPTKVMLSAQTGEGIDVLYRAIDEAITRQFEIVSVDIPHTDSATIAWLHAHGDVMQQSHDEQFQHLRVKLSHANAGRLRRRLET